MPDKPVILRGVGYSLAPSDPVERRAFFDARNGKIQLGVRPRDGVTFGAKQKDARA